MKNYLKKNGYNINEYPEFPPKKLFFANTAGNIKARMDQINLYFNELFKKYPQKVPFTNALIDLCQPLRLSVAVIGAHKSGKSALIKGMARLLTEQTLF